MMADLKGAGISGVIAQAITGLDGKSYTAQQCDVVARSGLKVGGYAWGFPGESQASIDNRLAFFGGHTLDLLAGDIEQAGLTIPDVDRLLDRCDQYWNRLTAFYTGRWFFAQQGWLNVTRWSPRPLWASIYDGIPDASVGFVPFAGWDHCAMKQYRGTSSIGRVQQIDLDVAA